VNKKVVPRYGSPTEYRTDDDWTSRPREFEREAALPPGTALVIVVLVSAGLWWGIWLAVSTLASLI
jgi:hypothetical protein